MEGTKWHLLQAVRHYCTAWNMRYHSTHKSTASIKHVDISVQYSCVCKVQAWHTSTVERESSIAQILTAGCALFIDALF